jgi:hypothetical protein
MSTADNSGSRSQALATDTKINLQPPTVTLDLDPYLAAIGKVTDSYLTAIGKVSTENSSSGSRASEQEGLEDPYNTEEQYLQTPLFQQFDKIREYLHWAGFRGYYRSLSNLRTNKGRQFERVDEHGLHLVWKNETQYIKPLPSCFNPAAPDATPDFRKLKPCLRGLFHSYMKLIWSEFDFDLAIEECLLPESFKGHGGWDLWQGYRAAYQTYVALETDAEPSKIHHRYEFGPLRLPRLNAIMWLTRPDGRSHFHQIEDPLFSFWRNYGAYIALIFVYLSLALSAMQVALIADLKPDWLVSSFRYASWAIIVLIIAQVPLFVTISLFWIFTTTAISPRFIRSLKGKRSQS